jgi:hypothetical protein
MTPAGAAIPVPIVVLGGSAVVRECFLPALEAPGTAGRNYGGGPRIPR